MSDLLTAVTTPPGQQTNVSAAVVLVGQGIRLSDRATATVSTAPLQEIHRFLSNAEATFLFEQPFLSQIIKSSSVDSNFEYLYRKLSGSVEPIRNAVEMNPRVMHGNPVFRGTRIPVYQIIEELADGTPLDEIPEGYPSLSLEQVQQGLDFVSSVMRIYDEQISDR